MKNIIIDITSVHTRTALVDNGNLIEVLIDDSLSATTIGNIYVGRIENIFNNFAFINIGKSKNAFIQLNDVRQRGIFKDVNGEKKLNIKIGQQIVVQVLKDENGEKGATVTVEISFPGKFVVLIKDEDNKKANIFVSKKVEDTKERDRLNNIATNALPQGYSIIMRTDCIEISEEEIINEINDLTNLSNNLFTKAAYIKAPKTLYSQDNIYEISLKSLLRRDINSIIVNSFKELDNIKSIASDYFPYEGDKVKVYQGDLNIFEEYEIETQIEKALNKKVWLKSGGYLIIEETEACVVIDVNSGKLTSKKKKNDVVLKNNIEAATEIAKQLRLRNLSGIIIIDFIDMDNESDKLALMSHLHKEFKKDRIGVSIVGMTSLGLVQLTRKKTKKPLSQYLLSKCHNCRGTGTTYSIEYIIDRIYKQTYRILKQTIYNNITINMNYKIFEVISIRNKDFKELEEKFNAKIHFAKLNYGSIEYFDIEKERS